MPDFWTADRIETMRVMHRDGHTSREIAITIGATRNQVIGKLHRLGFVNPSTADEWTPERVAILKEMHIAGTPYAEIATACGFSIASCRQKAHRIGLATRPHNSLKRRAPSERKPLGFRPRLVEGIPEPSKDLAAPIYEVTGCLWAITPHDCDKAGHLFCNHEKEGAGSYCAYHAEMNRAKPMPKGQVKRFVIPTSLLRVA